LSCCTNGCFSRGAQLHAGKPERNRPLGGPRCTLADNIKIDLTKGDTDWIDLAYNSDQWRDLVNTEMNVRDFLELLYKWLLLKGCS
jgi:hypothetical protein